MTKLKKIQTLILIKLNNLKQNQKLKELGPKWNLNL